MIDENKPQYVWKNHRMEFKSKDDEKLYRELKAKKPKISLYDFVKNGYKISDEVEPIVEEIEDDE